MRKISSITAVIIAAVMLIGAGCGNEVDKAIKQLGGNKKEQEEAMAIIRVSGQNPKPHLINAINDDSLSAVARKNVAVLIGSTDWGPEDKSPVPALMEAVEDAEPEVQEAILDALDDIDNQESIEALQALLDSKNKEIAQTAWDILDEKAALVEAKADALSGAEAMDRKIELLEEAVAIHPRDQELVKKLSSFYNLTGQEDKALELKRAGGTYVTEIKVLGPFRGDKDEQVVDPASLDMSGPVQTNDGETAEWETYKHSGSDPVIDFRRVPFTRRTPTSHIYVAFKLVSDDEMDVLLKLSSASDTAMWLNGEKVFEATEEEMSEKDEHVVPAKLQAGDNKVVIWLWNRKFSKFSLRMSDRKNKRTDAVKFGL